MESQKEAIDAAGADVVVLTADTPEVLSGLDYAVPIASVSPTLWAELGLATPRNPDIPHPATFIVDTEGNILLQEIHVDYRKRTPVVEMLAAINAADKPLPPAAPVMASQGPDWDSGVRFSWVAADDCLQMTAQIKEGFHLYGARETTGRPLAVSLDQAPTQTLPIPDGTEKTLAAFGASWILAGETVLQWPRPAGVSGALSGTVRYQLCTDRSCSRPRELAWKAEPSNESCPEPQ